MHAAKKTLILSFLVDFFFVHLQSIFQACYLIQIIIHIHFIRIKRKKGIIYFFAKFKHE
jgi:hypothetical protein